MGKTRPLMIAVIAMGVLVILGTTVVIVKVVKDMMGGNSEAAVSQTVTLTTHMLSQPAGSHIVTIAGAGDRLSVLVNGGGPDRILFVDPASGAVTGQLMLGR